MTLAGQKHVLSTLTKIYTFYQLKRTKWNSGFHYHCTPAAGAAAVYSWKWPLSVTTYCIRVNEIEVEISHPPIHQFYRINVGSCFLQPPFLFSPIFIVPTSSKSVKVFLFTVQTYSWLVSWYVAAILKRK